MVASLKIIKNFNFTDHKSQTLITTYEFKFSISFNFKRIVLLGFLKFWNVSFRRYFNFTS